MFSVKKLLLSILFFGCIFCNAQPNPDSCDTWTFQLRLGRAGVSELPADVVQLPTENYIIVGADSIGSSVKARIVKLNKKGEILISKQLSDANADLRIKQVQLFSNGDLYCLATSTAGPDYMPVLYVVDTSDLSIKSVLRMGPSTGSVKWRGAGVDEGRNNSFFIFSHTDTSVNVTKVQQPAHTILWSKTYKTRNAPHGVGVQAEYNDIFVAWNEVDSGFNKGVLMTLDFNTGNFKKGGRVGGLKDSINIELQSMVYIHSRPRITALRWKDGIADLLMLNFDHNGFADIREIFNVDGFSASRKSLSAQNFRGEMIAVSDSAVSPSIHFVRTFPDNYNLPIKGWKLTYSYPVRLIKLIYTNDGGALMPTRIPGSGEMGITKMDSSFSLPGCAVQQKNAGFTRSQQVSVPDVLAALPTTLVFTPTFSVTTDPVLTVNTECRTIYCPAVPEEDACMRSFFKEYRVSSNSLFNLDLLKLDNDDLLTYGYNRQNPYVGQNNSFFTLYDTSGVIKDARELNGAVLLRAIKLRDGNLLGTGTISDGDSIDIFVIKFTPQFNMLWQKRLVSSPRKHTIEDIMESEEGDIYCYLLQWYGNNTETRGLLKLDATGTPLWLREYAVGQSTFTRSFEAGAKLLDFKGSVMMKFNEEASDYSPFIMRIRKVDGTIEWLRKYQMDGPYNGSSSFHLNSMVTNGNTISVIGRSQGFTVFLKLGEDGSVLLSRRVSLYELGFFRFTMRPNGNLRTTAYKFNHFPSLKGIIELDSNFTVVKKQFLQYQKHGYDSYQIPYSDSVTYIAGNFSTGNPFQVSVYLLKTNFNTSNGICAVSDLPVNIESYPQSSTARTITSTLYPLPVVTSLGATFSYGKIAYSAKHCGNSPDCTSIALLGPTQICDTVTVYEFRALKNALCKTPVLWKLDTTAQQVKLISVSDSLIRFKALRSGSFKVSAGVFGNCTFVRDSQTVDVTVSSSFLDLGKDTSLCTGNTLVLRAGDGFSSYLWQDGSTDSTFTVTTPGLYHVQVMLCGNLRKDSVLVTAAAPPLFTAGSDRIKCNSDTVVITATTGFLNYTWSNAYNIVSSSGNTLIVDPSVDTSYYVAAEKTPGCFAFDTVRIKVYHSPSIDLGTDTSFCSGGSILLNAANPAFQSYSWNTGSTLPGISVSAPGNYDITATTANGCISRDTIRVVNVWPIPVFQLQKKSELCAQDTLVLDPGNFTSYLWQNGSVNRTYSVSSIGKYVVQVKDANGCMQKDSMEVTNILPLPFAFLSADTIICSYSNIILKASNNYTAYHWNTGSRSPVIETGNPAMYWLEVTDSKGCTGRDSIRVDVKNCMTGVFVPNAFTPNNDNNNDVFRARAFGIIANFRLRVYNKWGELVYETTDHTKGWDGKHKGALLRTDIFVWTCSYELGGIKEFQKGTVTLLR